MTARNGMCIVGNAVVEFPAGDALQVGSGGTGDTGSAWTYGTVGASSTSGSLGAASGTYRFKTIGKTVHYALLMNISNIGSASGAIQVALPVAAFNGNGSVTQTMVGRENAQTGYELQGYLAGSNLYITQYNQGANILVNGAQLCISGVYESA